MQHKFHCGIIRPTCVCLFPMFPRGQKSSPHPTPCCLAHSRCSGAKGQGGIHFLYWEPLKAREMISFITRHPALHAVPASKKRAEQMDQEERNFSGNRSPSFLACLLCSSFSLFLQLIISTWCQLLKHRPLPPRRPVGEG